jgi:hypothetical protein
MEIDASKHGVHTIFFCHSADLDHLKFGHNDNKLSYSKPWVGSLRC